MTAEEYESIILSFIYALTLCVNMLDVGDEIDVVLKKLGKDIEWERWDDLRAKLEGIKSTELARSREALLAEINKLKMKNRWLNEKVEALWKSVYVEANENVEERRRLNDKIDREELIAEIERLKAKVADLESTLMAQLDALDASGELSVEQFRIVYKDLIRQLLEERK